MTGVNLHNTIATLDSLRGPRVGDLQVSSGAAYDRPGEWVVEEYAYWSNDDTPSWAVPGWVEDRFGEDGFFKTEALALEFLNFVAA